MMTEQNASEPPKTFASGTSESESSEAVEQALSRLRSQMVRGQRLDKTQVAELDGLLRPHVIEAQRADPEILTVMNPTSHPKQLKLSVVVSDIGLDPMYGQEWAELAVSDAGRAYLVYRRRDGGEYAVEWSSSTALPTNMMKTLPPLLADIMLSDH